MKPSSSTTSSRVGSKRPGGKGFKRPSSSSAKKFELSKQEEFDRAMSKISMDWRDVCSYNRSFFVPPPCSWPEWLEPAVLICLKMNDVCFVNL